MPVNGRMMVKISQPASRANASHFQRPSGLALLRALTPREREVMQLVVTGQHNRDIGPELGISVRTVEVHKARLMDKLGVDNVADLVRISMLGSG